MLYFFIYIKKEETLCWAGAENKNPKKAARLHEIRSANQNRAFQLHNLLYFFFSLKIPFFFFFRTKATNNLYYNT